MRHEGNYEWYIDRDVEESSLVSNVTWSAALYGTNWETTEPVRTAGFLSRVFKYSL